MTSPRPAWDALGWLRIRGEMRDGVLHLDPAVQPTTEQQTAQATCAHGVRFGLPPTLVWGYLAVERWCPACGDFWVDPERIEAWRRRVVEHSAPASALSPPAGEETPV